MRVDEEVARQFRLDGETKALLHESVITMDRRRRKLFRREIEPRLNDMRSFVAALFDRERLERGPAVADEWATWIATDVAHRGFTSVIAQLAMDVVGRGKVARVLDALK